MNEFCFVLFCFVLYDYDTPQQLTQQVFYNSKDKQLMFRTQRVIAAVFVAANLDTPSWPARICRCMLTAIICASVTRSSGWLRYVDSILA